MPDRAQEVVLLGSGRTGSTWLGETLGQHPDIEYGAELFQRPNFPACRDEGLCNCTKRVYCWKYLRYQTAASAEVFDKLTLNTDVPIVFLCRENLAQWYVSGVVADHRKVYVKREGQSLADVPPFAIDFRLMEFSLKRELWYHTNVRERFADHKVYWLTYEQLQRDYVACVRGVFDFLKLPQARVIQTTAKIQTVPYSQQVSNWQDVLNHFRGTSLGRYVW